MTLYLVTGGAGFIGSNIVEELLRRGEKVRILDNFSTGKRENIFEIKKILETENKAKNFENLEVIEGDIRSYHIVRDAVDGVDYILHQAALPSVPRSIKDPLNTNEVNVVGTLNILNAAKDAKVKRIVFASSSSVYGNSKTLPKTENMTPNPLSPYAVSKLTGEKYCQVFSMLYGLETIILRYFNVFGPRQDPNSQYSAVIPRFIKLMKEGNSPIIYGDGKQSRDFTFVANVVKANLLACRDDVYKCYGEVFNIATGENVTLNELVSSINILLQKNIKPKYENPRPGDVKHSLADIDKAKQILRYKVEINFFDGLKKVVI